jgi:hypothetical protein
VLTLPDHNTMVLNILAFYARATASERYNGFRWYPSAYDSAVTYATRYGVSVTTAAAVIAALSPQTEWGHNLRWADETIAAYVSGNPLPRRGLGNNVIRAERALRGDTADIMRESGTLKVRNFYGSIIGERGAVCVDRHAIRIALGDSALASPPGLTDKRYNLTAEAYRDAARELGKGARHVQAVTWIVCKRERGE